MAENSIGRICKFKILQDAYRGDLEEHPIIFAVCAQIAQIDIQLNPLRTEVENTEQETILQIKSLLSPFCCR